MALVPCSISSRRDFSSPAVQLVDKPAISASQQQGHRSIHSESLGFSRFNREKLIFGSSVSYTAFFGQAVLHRVPTRLHLKQPCTWSQLFTSAAPNACARALELTSVLDIDTTPNIEWDNLGFGIRETDQMYIMKSDQSGEWYQGELQPFGNLELSPSAGVLNYGQGAFEGLKAYRTENGSILLFRPEENAMRMIASAERLYMPAPSVDVFVQAVKQTVLANKRWIPPPGKGSLYIRPLLIGSGAIMGLAPAPEYTFLIYVSPVGNYFKEGLAPIHLKVETAYPRAVPGGTGAAKAIGNYASVLKTQLAAKKDGYSDVLYLDALEKKYLEEVSSCNIFVVKGNKVATPELRGTILPGITRKSIVELARAYGYEVEERPISVDELAHADEVFCTGTAVVVSPVGSISYKERRQKFQELWWAFATLQHFRGKAIKALRGAGTKVDVLGEELRSGRAIEEALKACQLVNAPILYRAAFRVPFSTLKYAMTLDGKIASSTGHAAWVSSQMSRQCVFSARGRSNAVVVGGNTVRRDNPRLTTRQEGGHLPVRVVMSRCLDLPEEANIWDVSSTPTIVMTQRGARKDFQKRLQDKGVEIVEFDFLTPKGVMDYCYDRGFLSVLWECGGTLAAPAIVSGVIHKVLAFVAPKIIGGITAPCPVGELGMVEMTQALNLTDVSFEKIGPDMLVSGYLQPLPDMQPSVPAVMEELTNEESDFLSDGSNIISFYKPWDAFGAFSNFSAHSILMPSSNGKPVLWKSVEHYYQAQKFEGVQDHLAQECMQNIKEAESPEEAARLGRSLGRRRPDLVREDWDTAKLEVMYAALRVKFVSYPFLQSLLLSTSGSILVEDCPHDLFWGAGRDGEGLSHLGRLMMKLREEFLAEKECGVIDLPQSPGLDSFVELSG